MASSQKRFLTLATKKAILEEQAQQGLTTAEVSARHWLDPHQIRRWAENHNEMMLKEGSRKTVHNGKPSIYAQCEPDILLFVERRRALRQGTITFLIVVVTIRQIVQELQRTSELCQNKSFSSLQKWAHLFLKRNSLSATNNSQCDNI